MPTPEHNLVAAEQGEFQARFDIIASEYDVFAHRFDVIVNEVKKYFANASSLKRKLIRESNQHDVFMIVQVTIERHRVKLVASFNLQ